MRNPANVRATAPVARFPTFESLGKLDECDIDTAFPRSPSLAVCAFIRACETFCRNALSEEKYIAEPHPVRSVEGNVPLQKCRIGLGPLAIDLIVERSVF